MSSELVRFLEFVEAPLQESERDFQDEFIRKLQDAVREVKMSREMGARYMTFQEMLNDERKEERRQIAKKMLDNNVPMKEIIMYTTLTEEEIRKLTEE